jgi:arsenate reductase-like glutaredoxin family protein
MKAFAATIAAEKAAEEAAAVAEVEAMIAEQARIEKAARFEAVKAEIEAINAKYAEAKAALVTEIISTFEQEREEMIATFEEKEAALERKVKAIIKANEYRQELENSVWNSPLVVTNSKAVKETAVKRAPQFQNMDILKALPLNGNAPFSLLKVS